MGKNKEEKYSVWNFRENKYPFSGAYKECENWIKENGNNYDYCIIP